MGDKVPLLLSERHKFALRFGQNNIKVEQCDVEPYGVFKSQMAFARVQW